MTEQASRRQPETKTRLVRHLHPGQPGQVRTSVPDAEVRRLLRQLRLAPMNTAVTVERVRRAWELGVIAFGSREHVEQIHDDVADSGGLQVPVRMYRSAAASRVAAPAIIWYHGGGFVFGGLNTTDGICRALANRTGACIVSVDYRLAPEHTLAEAKADCLAAAEWVADNATRLGIDASCLSVGGDSAGGAWAALVSHAWRRSSPLISQLLAYPATKLGAIYEESEIGAALTLDHAQITWLQDQISRTSRLDDPEFSPVSQVDASPAPPTILLTAGYDYLLDEDLEYAERLVTKGVPVTLLHYPGQLHGFLSFDRVLAGGVDGTNRLAAAYRELVEDGVTPTGFDVRPPYATRRDRWRWITPRQRRREMAIAWQVVREGARARARRGAARRS